ncbi:MAG: alpha/beta hydrolase, partial [Spirochaetia bacterium]|nr:alpha/beta hydrolase [Spirochaetia bacterium]
MRGSISTILLLSVLFLSSCASLEDLPNLSRVEEVASPLDEFIEIEGYSLRYSRYSSSDMASPIILLHGFMSHIHSWDLVGAALNYSYSLYGYDRMPFGLSQRPLVKKGEEINPYENKQILNRAISFLDYFEIDSTVIIGHSAGGNLALQMALDYPERVTALILIDPAVYGSPPRFVSWLLKSSLFDRLGLKITRNLAKDPESLFDRAWYDRTKISDELINHYLEPLKVENWDR